MYLFSCAAVLLISHYSIKRPSGNVHLRQDIMRLPNVMGSREEAMTAINIPDAGPQMTYVQSVPKSKQYSKAQNS